MIDVHLITNVLSTNSVAIEISVCSVGLAWRYLKGLMHSETKKNRADGAKSNVIWITHSIVCASVALFFVHHFFALFRLLNHNLVVVVLSTFQLMINRLATYCVVPHLILYFLRIKSVSLVPIMSTACPYSIYIVSGITASNCSTSFYWCLSIALLLHPYFIWFTLLCQLPNT